MSLPEVLLWRELRKRAGGSKFRRQCPIAPYTLDFACLGTRLAIEIDGEVHNRGGAPQRDARRDETMVAKGFSVLRITARDVFDDLESVVNGIVARCEALGPLHRPADGPPPRAGEDFS